MPDLMKRVDERLEKADKRETVIALRVTGREKLLLDDLAEKRGVNLSELIRDTLLSNEIKAELPDSLHTQLLQIADALKLPLNTVIVHFLARKFAYHAAHFNVFGNTGQPLKEFFWEETDDGMKRLVTGQELYDTLLEDYERLFNELKQLVVELVEARKEIGLVTELEEQKFGEFVFAL